MPLLPKQISFEVFSILWSRQSVLENQTPACGSGWFTCLDSPRIRIFSQSIYHSYRNISKFFQRMQKLKRIQDVEDFHIKKTWILERFMMYTSFFFMATISMREKFWYVGKYDMFHLTLLHSTQKMSLGLEPYTLLELHVSKRTASLF